jgi:hypothetical protein
MGLVSQIAGASSIPVRHIGRRDLIAAADAERFVRACEQSHVLIVGIEGFRLLSHGRYEPDMHWIADFSSLADSGAAAAKARSFATGAPAELLFEFDIQDSN